MKQPPVMRAKQRHTLPSSPCPLREQGEGPMAPFLSPQAKERGIDRGLQ